MEPTIVKINEKKLVGKMIWMSLAEDRTSELWKNFSMRKNEIKHVLSEDLYSVEIYNDENFFVDFNYSRKIEKWAAIEVEFFDDLPDGFGKLTVPPGEYAVFHYIGKPSEANKTIQFIYGVWLPRSTYKMDNRPYFALMGEKYIGEDSDSEEEFWIPVSSK